MNNIKKNYWDENTMQYYFRAWVTGSTVTRSNVYKKIYPSFKRMQEAINKRYYSTVKNNYLNEEIINDCFLSIEKYNDRWKSYSFFSAVIKFAYNNYFKKKKLNTVEYNTNISVIDNEYEISVYDLVNIDMIYDVAKELSSTDNNYYKYTVWYDHYFNKLTYSKLSQKYKLTNTPLFNIVQDFNSLIREYVFSKFK